MKNLKCIVRFFLASLLLVGYVSCKPKEPEIPVTPPQSPDEKEKEKEEELTTYRYVNQFLFDALSVYYLWIDDPSVSTKMNMWNETDEPIAKVKSVKYSADRWTMCTADYDSFTSSTSGVETTYGYDVTLYWADANHTAVCGIVTFVYADSPAEKAGLKRGDVVMKVNGKTLGAETYVDIVNNEMFNSSSCKLDLYDGRSLDLTSIKMYEDPILVHKVIDLGAKKVGYLCYVSFTLRSIPQLIDVFREFKNSGVTDVVLDLRYNGGGYIETEEAMASMLAPEKDVLSSALYQTSVWNKANGRDSSFFRTDFTYETSTGSRSKISTKGSNVSSEKTVNIYAIMTGGSASASESILVGLIPYMDVTIVGEQSYGKYCSGVMLGAVDWYSDNIEVYRKYYGSKFDKYADYAKNWGAYIMYARFADKDGNTPCMPDGFAPEVEARDDPEDETPLGDPEEKMLKVVLGLINGEAPAALPSTKATALDNRKMEFQHRPANFGMHISGKIPPEKDLKPCLE